MTDYTEAAKQLAWDNLQDATRQVYVDRAIKADAEARGKMAQLEVVADAIAYARATDSSGDYIGQAEAAIAAYLSTVPKSDATTQGRISYG